MKKIDLNGKWKFRAINAYGILPPHKRDVTHWMSGTVPGTVHTDLLANRKIPDPFYGMNENDVQWVDSQQWIYRRSFVVPPELLAEDAVHLVAKGLDTYAQIWCNGRVVGKTANMFNEYRFDVKKYVRKGKNTIEVLFDSPTVRSKMLERKYGRLQVAHESHRAYIRKAQYSFGWDWGPKLATLGIWRDIFLEGRAIARIKDAHVKVVSVNKARAIIILSVGLERFRRTRLMLKTLVTGEQFRLERWTRSQSNRAVLRITVPRPRLWWPNGYGDQSMYTVSFALFHGDEDIDELVVPFGIRTVRLLQEKDREGKSFVFEINGKKIFCKGANWIPSDSFIPRIRPSTYEKLLQMAKDVHMNMIRVWGGGIYEQDVFFDLCDRLGLMVWQDFMYACGEYPERPWFLRQVREEAEYQIMRLRNHPSIVLWCGNNECEWIFCMANRGKVPDDMNGATIFRDLLPSLCRTLDRTRPYWRSTPWGKGFPNDESNGNHHQWEVWSGWKDYTEYERNRARFVTEFGFQAPANTATLESVTRPSDRYAQSAVLEHHNKQIEGTERLFRFQAAHYEITGDLEDFIYKGQLVQAQALKTAVEHWRRRMFSTAGALFWQLNDCWPISSWAVVDSALRPKAAFYYARRFFSPVLVSFRKRETLVEVWTTNDTTTRIHANVEVALMSWKGKRVWSRVLRATVAPNASRKLLDVEVARVRSFDPGEQYLRARVVRDGETLAENRLLFREPKHLRFPTAAVRIEATQLNDRQACLTVRADAFVKDVFLTVDGSDAEFEDNYYDLDARTSKRIVVTSGLTAKELVNTLKVRWL